MVDWRGMLQKSLKVAWSLLSLMAIIGGALFAQFAIKTSFSSNEIFGFIGASIVIILGLAALAAVCYGVWKIISTVMLYLNNSRLKMEIERRELEDKLTRRDFGGN
ncbi:hypothetical protein SAMN06265338_103189 [Rhodoblastus acidophilus]|uniref:Uncharacterized protein n=1 Tax=Rhodoblastus acidophilus TaxID=1074 RepID=A0A212RAL2_RHOAC|nr:hypothetical protein [Rhodoblastus acidophilus]PPQ39346.1 hypothetical protein CKO16_06220 [Rhodoblastus acidophilus]RAI22418.1 hypothetical protein CH337_05415 [Rhodoblastus acidophilus]SNB69256.1 hypothetical protein SAMN06265338_103189 [Rhodoblastus acidophilus]